MSRPTRKKSRKNNRGGKRIAVRLESDSIHNSEDQPISNSDADNATADFNLEVVLPCISAGREGSGMSNFLQLDGSVGRESRVDLVIPVREEVEAVKLIGIEEEVGLIFHGGDGEVLGRTVAMEGRDRAEKEEWKVKKRKVRDLISVEKVDFLALQETKLEAVSGSFCNSLWGSAECDWVALPAVGNSGGILSIWRKSLGSVVFSFSGDGFVGVCLDLVEKQVRCGVINVYAKCNLVDKRRLWSDILMTTRGFGGVVWCVVGDFNSVIDLTERRGVGSNVTNFPSREMVEFGQFLSDLELVDMPITGRQFTWSHPNGITMSRLDRILLSSDWFLLWGNPNVWVAPRDVSDHCPLILRYDSADWGAKPFRFNNFWLKNNQFKELIAKTWERQHVSGWMGYILKDRLKDLKVVIKRWNSETYGKPDVRKKMLVEHIKDLDVKSETTGISAEEVEMRKRLFVDLWTLLKSIDASIFQRSRSRWIKEGDANTSYFHARVNARGRRNLIVALQTENGLVEGPANVRQATVSFYKQHFSKEEWKRPTLDGVVFPVLSEENNSILTAPFTIEEIEGVVKECDGSRCPGPDGFNFAFIKEFWTLMKNDVRILFDQFHGNDCIPKCLLSYFLTLIPKVKSPQNLGDFRPISLLGCWYKLLAKVLASRLARVIGVLIPNTQSAFLKGRQLVEGVVVVNEVIDFAKKAGKDCLILKVDFEKAYDSVDWGFLDYMLGRFGFCAKWRAWMRACVCGGNLSVLVNGSPTEEFQIRRGLKQGDPLAPLLFLLVAEGLGGLMRRAVEINKFRPFLVGRGAASVSLLQYADDTLCIGEATVENLWVLKAVLRGFEMASGLKVNFWKSCVMGVNVHSDFMEMASDFLNCRIGRVPFKYLGLPVGSNPRKLSTWEPMLEVVRGRLRSWGNKYVSLGGRIVLINAVLSAIPIFFLSYLKMPNKVWREMVKMQRKFLWSGLSVRAKTCWVKWDDICRPKKEAGLGIRDLRLVNISLLAKWRWKLLSHEYEVWKEVVMARYGRDIIGKRNIGELDAPRTASSWWRDLCLLDSEDSWFMLALGKKVGRGDSTSFWNEVWAGNQSLRQRFPRLYGISTQQTDVIHSLGSFINGRWQWILAWRRQRFVWEEDQYREFVEVINSFVPTDDPDVWLWLGDGIQGFTVNSAFLLLENLVPNRRVLEPTEELVFDNLWKSAAPSKVCAFSWQLILDR
ncbi:LINE-1 reverse transcriptase like, partial [Trifolium medium]|nr:LINE-1 reverse transcriptase like [Trifolium medium]